MWIISLLIVLLGDTKYPVETALYIVAMAVGIIFKDRLFLVDGSYFGLHNIPKGKLILGKTHFRMLENL